MGGGADKQVTLGRVLGPWGVKGWIKVFSYTDPIENILEFRRWQLKHGDETRSVEVEDGRRHGSQIVVKLGAVDDRDAAEALAGAEVAVERRELAPCGDGEYYWTDLEGLRVVTSAGVELGRIDHLFATGSNDVMVVAGNRQRLIPFIAEQVVRDVDVGAGIVVVDWDPEF